MTAATRAHASVRLYTDGASRGNPGPSASAWIIVDSASGEVLAERSVFIGRGTNNEAEYTAIIGGLRDCLALGAREVEAFSDSQLCMHQLARMYRVREPRLRAKYDEIMGLIPGFGRVRFAWVPRGDAWISRCDRVAKGTIADRTGR